MSARLRVFVSSTMEDLANERAAVVEAIEQLNFEPVNAEGILPNGASSWEVLEPEIRSSHLCVLIQGKRYGWIPQQGYGANQGKSVTHLEIDVARNAGIPILPFFQKLKYGADSVSPDAVLRDKFRKDISDWEDGLFRGEFELASDLKDKVFNTVVGVLTSTFLRNAVDAQISRSASKPESTPVIDNLHFPTSPKTISSRQEALFAGAGMSLSAGYPSADALVGIIGKALDLDSGQTSCHSLDQLFDLAIAELGRARTVSLVRELLNPPLPVEPTSAHIAAVRRFPVIITTNFDNLFERACELLNIPFSVRVPGKEVDEGAEQSIQIFKIDGTIEDPETLVLSPLDAERARMDVSFWTAVGEVLQNSHPIVIGHSMRDSKSQLLMSQRNKKLKGVYVAPRIDGIVGRLFLDRLNLEGVEGSASEYLLSS